MEFHGKSVSRDGSRFLVITGAIHIGTHLEDTFKPQCFFENYLNEQVQVAIYINLVYIIILFSSRDLSLRRENLKTLCLQNLHVIQLHGERLSKVIGAANAEASTIYLVDVVWIFRKL